MVIMNTLQTEGRGERKQIPVGERWRVDRNTNRLETMMSWWTVGLVKKRHESCARHKLAYLLLMSMSEPLLSIRYGVIELATHMYDENSNRSVRMQVNGRGP